MSAQPPLLEAAAEVQQQLRRLGLRFVIIGGMAVLRWGEARVTRDVDFALLCAFGDERRVIDAVLGAVAGRIEGTAEFAERHRVLLLAAGNGRPIDISLAGLPYEERAIERGSDFDFTPSVALRTCSAEDLVIMKAFAGRPIDFKDIEGIVARQGSRLDWQTIESELQPLLALKEDQATWQRLKAMRSGA